MSDLAISELEHHVQMDVSINANATVEDTSISRLCGVIKHFLEIYEASKPYNDQG